MLKNLKCELDLLLPCENDASEVMIGIKEQQSKDSVDLPTRNNDAENAHMGTPAGLIPPTILQAGQKLHGTIWRKKRPSELFNHIESKLIRISLEECLEGRIEESSKDKAQGEGFDRSYNLPRVELQELDLKRWTMASEAPRLTSEKEEAKSEHLGISTRRCWFENVKNCSGVRLIVLKRHCPD